MALAPDTRAALIAEKVRRGELPAAGKFRLWVGESAGALCQGCAEEIERKELEYEVELPTSALRLHRECYLAWAHPTRASDR